MRFDLTTDVISLEVPGSVPYSVPNIEIDGLSLVNQWIQPGGSVTGDWDAAGPPTGAIFDLEVVSVAAQDLGDGTIEIVVDLNGAIAPGPEAAIIQLGVRVEDGTGGALVANYGFVGPDEVLVSQDLRAGESPPALGDARVEVSPDGTRVTFVLAQSDFAPGADAQASAFMSIAEELGSQPAGNVVGPVPIGS